MFLNYPGNRGVQSYDAKIRLASPSFQASKVFLIFVSLDTFPFPLSFLAVADEPCNI